MEEILKFLQEAKVFYLATVDGDQPKIVTQMHRIVASGTK